MIYLASCGSLRGGSGEGSAPGAGEGFEQQEDFGRVVVVKARALGQRGIAAAAEDGFEGVEQWQEVGGELRPAKTRGGFLRKADDFGHTLVEPAFQSMMASSGRQQVDPKPDHAKDDGIDRNLTLVPPQPFNHLGIWGGLGGLAEHVRINKVDHSVSVDSDSMGTKKPFSGQASSQSTSPSFGGSLRRASQYSPRLMRSISNCLPRLDAISLPDFGGENDLAFRGNRVSHAA